MTELTRQKLTQKLKERIAAEGGPKRISDCAGIMLKAASAGQAKEKDLVSASVAGEFFYQALHSHYWPGKGQGADIILGDYYGSIAIAYAAKLKDQTVLRTFCRAIQAATETKDGKHKAAGRLAKIYGASAYVGAYLAGLNGRQQKESYEKGEKEGLQIEKSRFVKN